MAEANSAKKTVSGTDVAVELINMNKWYGEFQVLTGIDLSVRSRPGRGSCFSLRVSTAALAPARP